MNKICMGGCDIPTLSRQALTLVPSLWVCVLKAKGNSVMSSSYRQVISAFTLTLGLIVVVLAGDGIGVNSLCTGWGRYYFYIVYIEACVQITSLPCGTTWEILYLRISRYRLGRVEIHW